MYRAGIKKDAPKAYEALKKEWATGASVDGKDLCLSSMGHVRDPEMIKDKIISFLFNISPPAPASDSVPSGDMHMLGGPLASNTVARPLLWKWMQENWDQVTKKMANPVVLDRFVRLTLGKFTDLKYLDEIDAFFKDKDTSSFDRTLEQVKDSIRTRAAYRQRDAAVIKEWLSANGYLS